MTKKILCPTDFSLSSTNAIEYAAKYAARVNATLTLLHVQLVSASEGVSLFSGEERESVTEAKSDSKTLKEICDRVNETFKVACSYEIIPSINSFEKVFANESQNFYLIILGTNGANNLYQFLFGTHSFRAAKKTNVPIIIIPKEYQFKEIKKIVFATDCMQHDVKLIQQLKQLITEFDPHIDMIHISEKDSEVSKENYRSFCNLAEESFDYDQRVTFERIINENKVEAINSFIQMKDAELLVMNMQEHGFIYRMLHKDLVKEITSGTECPVLIIHE